MIQKFSRLRIKYMHDLHLIWRLEKNNSNYRRIIMAQNHIQPGSAMPWTNGPEQQWHQETWLTSAPPVAE